MSALSSREARDRLHAVVKRVEATDERVILTRRGKALAAMISAADLAWFEQLEREARARVPEARRESSDSTRPGPG